MPKHIYLRSKIMWFSLRRWKRRLLFWGGAVSVGFAAILLAVSSTYVLGWLHAVLGVSPYLSLLLTPLGLALIAFITSRHFTGAQGSGIPQTIAALKLSDDSARQGLLSVRIAIGKIFLTLLGLLSGASIGREGPTVQIGASIMHALGRLGQFTRHETERGLILAGGAAGVAAAFNTPLAGVVFAIEEMSRSFEERTSGAALTAIIVAGIASLGILGNYTYFGHTSESLGDHLYQGWIGVLVCGTIGGLLGGIFSTILINAARLMPERLRMFMKERPVAFAAACGLVLAVIGIASGSTTYGTGYEETRHILEGQANIPESFGILKMVATIVSYISGIPGGIFAPSMSIGAGFGFNLSSFFPDLPAGAVVILGMVAYFTGVVQAPITGFVIVMEMTDNHSMTIPLMATAAVAYASSRIICPTPLYKALSVNFLPKS
jgi:H+/Cl- antiporter ClcA